MRKIDKCVVGIVVAKKERAECGRHLSGAHQNGALLRNARIIQCGLQNATLSRHTRSWKVLVVVGTCNELQCASQKPVLVELDRRIDHRTRTGNHRRSRPRRLREFVRTHRLCGQSRSKVYAGICLLRKADRCAQQGEKHGEMGTETSSDFHLGHFFRFSRKLPPEEICPSAPRVEVSQRLQRSPDQTESRNTSSIRKWPLRASFRCDTNDWSSSHRMHPPHE